MHTLPTEYKAPALPVISEEAYAELEALLAGIPDDEPLRVDEQVDCVVTQARFSADMESQPAALLNALVDWLWDNRVDALSEFLCDHYPPVGGY